MPTMPWITPLNLGWRGWQGYGRNNASFYSILQDLERLIFRVVEMNNFDLIIDLQNPKELNLLFGSYNLDVIASAKKLESLEISS